MLCSRRMSSPSLGDTAAGSEDGVKESTEETRPVLVLLAPTRAKSDRSASAHSMGLKDKLANVDVRGLTSVFKRDDDGENDGLRGGKGGGGAHSGLGYTKDGGLSRGPWQRFDSGDGSSGNGGVGMLLYLTRGSQVGLAVAAGPSVNLRASRRFSSGWTGTGLPCGLQSTDGGVNPYAGLLPPRRTLH